MGRRGGKRTPHTVSNTEKTGGASPAASDTPSGSDAGRSENRRVPNWARFVIGAFVTAVIGLLVANLYPDLKGKIVQTPPVLFKVNQVFGAGFEATIPDQHRLQPLLNSINGCNSLHTAALSAGGADDYGTDLDVLLQGNTSSGVTITGMHVHIIKRSAPLNGAYAFCQSAGSEEVMPINFNLNDQTPSALGSPAGSSGQGSKPSFFANGSVVHLSNGEVFPLRVGATVSGSSVQWVIDVSVLINGNPETVTIDNHGRPFETTAALPLSQYGDLYEYDWASEDRLLHFRSQARSPDDCAANVAVSALRRQGLSRPAQVLSVDCARDLAHVEVWVPSYRCFVHYLGFHRQSQWSFFASREICPGSPHLGALFSRATISHAGGNPQEFADAFGPYIVSSASAPANPGPYDHVSAVSVGDLANRAGCRTMQTFGGYSLEVGASQTATCSSLGVSFLILTFPDSLNRNEFYNRAYGGSNSLEGKAVGNRQLLVIGPSWLVYGSDTFKGGNTYVAGRTAQQFADQVGGENGLREPAGADSMSGNQVPTVANGGL